MSEEGEYNLEPEVNTTQDLLSEILSRLKNIEDSNNTLRENTDTLLENVSKLEISIQSLLLKTEDIEKTTEHMDEQYRLC